MEALQSDLRPSGDDRQVAILGIKINNVDMAAALDTIDGFIRSREPRLIVTADASGVVLAQSDSEFKEIVNSADLVTPDSIGILWAARRQGTPLKERVSGVDMVRLICERAAAAGHSVFLLGAAPGIADEAAKNLQERYPGLKIAGTHHGFFTEDDVPALVEKIRAAAPDVLFVALGIPRQEKWIRQHMKEIGVPVSMGVGGSFDVISGRVQRAPKWMQKHGLEWAFRLANNPRKIGKCATLPRFVAMVLLSGGRN